MEGTIKKRVRMQILILVASILLVVVLIFAMTAAWFTNVAKTGDLVFQTESWGFDADKISLSDSAISITPGTSGIVPLTIDNRGSTESVQIGVTISKEKMETEMQKRIFFYADTSQTNDTEAASRIYLGASAPDNYTYTILPGQILTMNDLYYNNVPIKWEWVYDMVGYYFRGTVNNSVVVDEYIRPIEYDYEQAVFEQEETGDYHQLIAVGEKTAAEFLEELSLEDGYEGTIDHSAAVGVEVTDETDGTKKTHYYYPVDVDGNGYGVWAYLCSFDEVEKGIAYDTEMANSQEDVIVSIVFTAMNVSEKTQNVQTEAALKEALTDSSVDVVKLETDILTGSSILFSEGNKIIDLNGYALQYDGVETEYSLLSVTEGATLTVVNGELVSAAEAAAYGAIKTKAVDAAAGNVVLSDVTVKGFDTAVYIEDMNAETGDSNVQVINCELETAQAVIALQGNGSASDTTTKLIIQNSTLTSKYNVAITGQGSTNRWGTELIIANSTVDGYYGGLYQPQQKSVTKIIESKISGNTGIAVKGGSVNIYDSEITGTGAVAADSAGEAASGYIDTGDAVYVEATYDWSATVTLEGEKTVITSDKAYAAELFGKDGKGPGKILIYDGTYSGTKGSANWNEIGTFEIYDGTYNGSVNDKITRYDITGTQ